MRGKFVGAFAREEWRHWQQVASGTRKTVVALAREEWMRVRRWYPWVVLALAAYAVGLYLLDAWAMRMYPSTRFGWDSGLGRMDEASRFPVVLLLLPPFFLALYGAVMLAVLPLAVQGVALAQPRRYMTLPTSLAQVITVHLTLRCLLSIPLGMLALKSLWIFWQDYLGGMWVWGVAPLIGCIGAQAIMLWWTRMERMAPALWLLVPMAIAWIPTFVPGWDWRETVTVSLLIPLLGVALGVWQLRRFGPLEGQDFSLNDWLSAKILPRGDRATVPAVVTPFRSPAAAIRWAERPSSLWWPVGLALAMGFVVAALQVSGDLKTAPPIPWQPWTPGWVKVCSIVQVFGGRWLDSIPITAGYATTLSMLFVGLGMTRRNLLRLPLAARLPVSPWAFGLHTALAGLRLTVVLALLLLAAMWANSEYGAVPNIGQSYVTPMVFPDHALTRHWAGEPSVIGLGSVELAFSFALIAWLVYFPLGLFLLLLSAWVPLDLALLGIFCAFVPVRSRQARGAWRVLLALPFACCLALVLFALTDLQRFNFLTTQTLVDFSHDGYGPTPSQILLTLLRYSLGAVAFFLLPVVCLWANIRLRSRY